MTQQELDDFEGEQMKREKTPRAQAKIDYKLLFGNKEDNIPVPCEPGLIKKALQDRKNKD